MKYMVNLLSVYLNRSCNEINISYIIIFSVQIMAYRLLARNQPLSQQLALAVQGKLCGDIS